MKPTQSELEDVFRPEESSALVDVVTIDTARFVVEAAVARLKSYADMGLVEREDIRRQLRNIGL